MSHTLGDRFLKLVSILWMLVVHERYNQKYLTYLSHYNRSTVPNLLSLHGGQMICWLFGKNIHQHVKHNIVDWGRLVSKIKGNVRAFTSLFIRERSQFTYLQSSFILGQCPEFSSLGKKKRLVKGLSSVLVFIVSLLGLFFSTVNYQCSEILRLSFFVGDPPILL